MNALWDQWDAILQNIVRDGLVDYSRAKTLPAFEPFITDLKSIDFRELPTAEQRMAFLINAYNALTVDLVLAHYPVDSIKDIGGWFSGPWSIEVYPVGDDALTLDEIEHENLRLMGDPRIHFAINCASQSCPVLSDTAFRADQLQQQLDEQRLVFITSSRGVQFEDDDSGDVKVSKIFSWFNSDWGGTDGVLEMLQDQHPNGEDILDIDGYMQYDWSLNNAR
ncbi:MAG: DUF547 domain-containing protein [Pseudomonadales bacterium]